MDIQKTREYYDSIESADLCRCGYCKNYIQKVKQAYPDVAGYLESLGVDICKPFETMPLDPDENGTIEYIAAQYVVMGDPDDFEKKAVSGVEVDISQSHPSTSHIEHEHFVIEISPVVLNWDMRTVSYPYLEVR